MSVHYTANNIKQIMPVFYYLNIDHFVLSIAKRMFIW